MENETPGWSRSSRKAARFSRPSNGGAASTEGLAIRGPEALELAVDEELEACYGIEREKGEEQAREEIPAVVP